MLTYKVVRQNNTGDGEHPLIKIWDGGNLLWEREADSYVEVQGQMVQLGTLTDVELIDLYRRENE